MVREEGQPQPEPVQVELAKVGRVGTGGRVMEPTKKPLTGLWRDNPETPEGKYLVQRRDGTVVETPLFIVAEATQQDWEDDIVKYGGTVTPINRVMSGGYFYWVRTD